MRRITAVSMLDEFRLELAFDDGVHPAKQDARQLRLDFKGS